MKRRLPAEQGAVLLTCLLLLLVMASAGIGSLSMATLELKLASNYRDQQLALLSADAALVEAESWLLTANLSEANWQQPCSGNSCFSRSCANGLCSTVNYSTINSCQLDPSSPWRDADLWNDPGRYRRTQAEFGSASGARYIIEFRCFTPAKPPTGHAQDPKQEPTKWEPQFTQYRITALGQGATTSARVLVQSRVLIPLGTSEEGKQANNSLIDEGQAAADKSPLLSAPSDLESYQQRSRLHRDWQQLEIDF